MKIELSDNDLREIHQALHSRAAELEKLANKLRGLGRENEAKNIDATRSDLRERLCTHIAAGLGQPKLGEEPSLTLNDLPKGSGETGVEPISPTTEEKPQ